MKLISPFAILRDVLNEKGPDHITCFIDDTEVAMKECGVLIDENMEDPKLGFWDEECDKHPTSSHCKVFD